MLDPIEHRRRQIENMNKAFSDNNEIEKAWKIGDEKQYQGATWVVGGFNAKGTPLWRKKKDGGGSGTAPAQTPASKSGSSKVSIDETTIDQKEYDRMHAQAQSVDKHSRSFALKIIEHNIKETKSKLEDTIKNRPGAKVEIANLQKKLTMFISQKKATEDVINEVKSAAAVTSFNEIKEGSVYKINGEEYSVAVIKELPGSPVIKFIGLVNLGDGTFSAKSDYDIDREIKNGDWEHVTEGKTGTDKKGSQKKDTAASSSETKYFTSQQIHAALRTNEAKKNIGGVYDDDVKKLKEKGIDVPANSASFHFGPFAYDGYLFDKMLSLPEYKGKLSVIPIPGKTYKFVSGDLKDIVSIAEDYWNSTEKNILDRVKAAEQDAKQSTSKQDSGTPDIIKLKDFNSVGGDRLKRIQGFLRMRNADNLNDQKILQDAGMDDDRLADLQAVAENNANNSDLNDKIRENCRKWNDLALAEINRRNKERKGGGKKTFSIKDLVDKMAAAAKDPIQVDTSNPKSMTDAVKEMFKRMGLDNKVEVGRSTYRSFYKFYLDGDVCSERRYNQDKTLSFSDFCISVNECIASAIIKNENIKGNNEITIKNLVAIKGPNWKQK